jgi:putative tryptophan/tyrosine transport system substrate-binding protein
MDARYRLTRRRFVQAAGVAGLGLLAGCERLPGQAPPVPQVRRVAYQSGAPPNARTEANIAAFREGLNDLGYVEGHNLLILPSRANGDDQLAEPVADLVRLQPEVILAASATVARALGAATTTIPVVSAGAGDLVATGVVASHARPGGNVTGLSSPPLAGKQLQLFQEAVPTLSRVLVLFDPAFYPNYPDWEREREMMEEAARILSLRLQFVGARGVEDLELALEPAVREHVDGLYMSLGPLIGANQARIAELAIRSRLPSMWPQSEAVARGGLMGYGSSQPKLFRRAAYYVDRILQGTKPSDLPIEEPREFDFIINLQTAQALGLTIPEHVQLQATEVIQ